MKILLALFVLFFGQPEIKTPGLPETIVIPKMNIESPIKPLFVNKIGEMETPDKAYDIGWFSLGSRPGETGSAVIAGHLNGKYGESGIFENLSVLKKDDNIYNRRQQNTNGIYSNRHQNI